MITFNKFAFASPPRTGTTWFMKTANAAGFGEGFKAYVHIPPPSDYGGFMVSIVRHPYDWLSSVYHELQGGKIGVPVFDAISECALGAKTFREFIDRLPENSLPAVFDAYRASTILRLEDMPWAADELFRAFGYKGDIINLSPQNCSKCHTPIDMALREHIVRREEAFCEQYDYWV